VVINKIGADERTNAADGQLKTYRHCLVA